MSFKTRKKRIQQKGNLYFIMRIMCLIQNVKKSWCGFIILEYGLFYSYMYNQSHSRISFNFATESLYSTAKSKQAFLAFVIKLYMY